MRRYEQVINDIKQLALNKSAIAYYIFYPNLAKLLMDYVDLIQADPDLLNIMQNAKDSLVDLEISYHQTFIFGIFTLSQTSTFSITIFI